MNKPPARVGRPSTYTKKKGDEVCAHMARGLSMNQISEIEGMPGHAAVSAWRNRYPEFAQQYARAGLDRLEFLADQMNEIADDGRNDYMDRLNAKGEVIGQMVNQEVVQRSRLRIDTIKWQLSKLIPKKYGDKLDLNLGGQNGTNPVQLEDARAANLAAIESLSARLPGAVAGATPAGAADTDSSEPVTGADPKLPV